GNAVESKARQNKSNQPNANSDDVTKVFSTITFMRGSLNVEKLLLDACADANKLSWSTATTEEKAKNRFVMHYIPKRTEETEHRKHRAGPCLSRRAEHAGLRVQPVGDDQPRADQVVDRHAGQCPVRPPDRGHRQRVPRPRERGPAEQHDVAHVLAQGRQAGRE